VRDENHNSGQSNQAYDWDVGRLGRNRSAEKRRCESEREEKLHLLDRRVHDEKVVTKFIYEE